MINAHRAILFKVCHVYCRERALQEDLFQEMVLQLWKSYPTFRHESRITTWMYRVALNTAVSFFRTVRKTPEQQSISKHEFQIPDIASFPEEYGNRDVLHSAIDRLTRIEKALVMLYLEEKSYQEISDILGIGLSNVGVKLNRIKIKLGKIIKSQSV